VFLASAGEMWKVLDGDNQESHKLARVQPVGGNKRDGFVVYIALFDDRETLISESSNHWAGSLMGATYSLQFRLGPNDTIAERVNTEDMEREGSFVFNILAGPHKYTHEVDLQFVKTVTDVMTDSVMPEPPKLRLSAEALEALGVCFETFITGETRSGRSTLAAKVMKNAP
jgi:hypothetical protein